jgi:AcrR family transcriptional regulator
VARHAGVGVGTAGRRFADKEELIDALFDDMIARVEVLAREAAEDLDVLGRGRQRSVNRAHLWHCGAMARIHDIVVDCRHPASLARFWAATLHADDLRVEVRRLVDLGATVLGEYDGWTALSDPEGNEFCVRR